MWIDLETKVVVKLHHEIRSMRPDVSLPIIISDDLIESLGFAPLVVAKKPFYNQYLQRVSQKSPELINGVYTITWLVEDIPVGEVLYNLNKAKEAKVAQIKAIRDSRKLSGVLVDGKWIHTDVFSRTQWMAMVMMGANLPAIEWTAMDYSQFLVTPAFAAKVFQLTAALDVALFNHAASLALKVDAFTLEKDVVGLDITDGWQETYTP